jgi:hypothetical protein
VWHTSTPKHAPQRRDDPLVAQKLVESHRHLLCLLRCADTAKRLPPVLPQQWLSRATLR